MKTLFRSCLRSGSALFATGILIAGAAAQQEPQDLPSAQEVVDRYVEATGGREAYEAVKTMIGKGTFRIPQANSEGKMEIYFAEPDKARLNVEIPNVGKIERGRLGDVTWEIVPGAGSRLLEGAEATRFLESVNMKTTYDPASVYETIENAGIEEVNGERCYKVTMQRKGSDDVDYTCYSVETGLALKSVTHEPTPFGTIAAHSTLSNYQEAGGIKSPMKIVQELAEMGMTQEIELDSVEYNEPIDDSVFELPESVQQLVTKSE